MGAKSSLSLKLWFNKAIRRSHGFLMTCWINLNRRRTRINDANRNHMFLSHLSRLFKSFAVSTCIGFGIICFNGIASPPPDLFPFVHPREYWKVCAEISSTQQAMNKRTKTLYMIETPWLNLHSYHFENHCRNDRISIKIIRFISLKCFRAGVVLGDVEKIRSKSYQIKSK